jgi:hypothetical protein
MSRRQIILNVIADQIADLLYYDRKADEALPVGAIEAAIKAGEITKHDMAAAFMAALDEGVK